MSYRSVFKPGLFAGQTIIVTGGGSGIGRCTAHEIAALGAHVVITGRKPEKLDRREGRDRGGRRHRARRTPSTSARKPRSRRRSPRSSPSNGRIHGLFNNAGGQFPVARRRSMSAKGFDVVVRNNLTGGFIVSREVFTQSMEQHGGSIVNMAADYAERLPQHGAHRRRARRHGQPHHDARLRMGRVAGVRVNCGVAGLDRLVRHGHLHGRVQGTDPQAQGLLPARPARHRERGVGRGLLPAERRRRPTSPAPRSASTAACRSATARWTCRPTDRSQPFNGFHLAKTPKVLGG